MNDGDKTACEHLVQYSKTGPSIFKAADLTPIKDLKLLVKDYSVCTCMPPKRARLSDACGRQPIAKNALTILVNISNDHDVLRSLATDDVLLETLLLRMMVRVLSFSSQVSA